jgi:hypothetical protein
MKLCTLTALGLAIVGLLAMEGSASAGGRKDVADSDSGNPKADIGTVETDSTVRSWEEVLRMSSREMTAEEIAIIAEKVKQNSTPSHYYPNSPDDGRMEPPPLNSDGQEI